MSWEAPGEHLSFIQSSLGARICFKASSFPKVTLSHHFLLLAAAQTFHLDLMYCVKTRVCRPFIPSPVSWERGISLRNHQKGSHMFSLPNGTKFPALTPSDRGWLLSSLRPAGVFFSVPWYNRIHMVWHHYMTLGETWPSDLHSLLLCYYIRRGANPAARKMNTSEGNTRTASCPVYPACWVSTFRIWGEVIAQKMSQSVLFSDVRVIWLEHLPPNTYLWCFMALLVYKSDLFHWMASPSLTKIMSYPEHMLSN